jgi:hypothetical protein
LGTGSAASAIVIITNIKTQTTETIEKLFFRKNGPPAGRTDLCDRRLAGSHSVRLRTKLCGRIDVETTIATGQRHPEMLRSPPTQ